MALYFQGENTEPEKSGAGGSGRTRKLKAIQNRLLPSLVHLQRRWLPLVTNPLELVLDLFLRLPRPRKPKRPEIWAHSRSPLTRARYLSPTFTPPPLPTARQHVDAQNDIRSRCATGREALWAWKMRQSNIWPLRSPPESFPEASSARCCPVDFLWCIRQSELCVVIKYRVLWWLARLRDRSPTRHLRRQSSSRERRYATVPRARVRLRRCISAVEPRPARSD